MDHDPLRQSAVGAGHDRSGPSYQIRLQGHLDRYWSAWLENLTIAHEEDGTTVLHGTLIDQAALYGVLIRIRDLGLVLVSVERVEHGEEEPR
jgi:hypothetical protein